MGRTPRSPQSLKHDTMGVGFDPNCPDRSWCVAQVGPHKTKRRHRSGKEANSQRGRTQEQKGKTEEAFKERTAGRSWRKKPDSRCDRESQRSRARLRSTPLRSARPTSTERKNLTD